MTSPDAMQQTRGWVPDTSAFGARLALLRQRMGWGNVKEAAEECGLPVESWRNWERDNREPRNYVDICRTISAATNVDLMWLMSGQAPEVVDTSERSKTRGTGRTFSCNTRGMRTHLHRPRHATAGAA